MSTHLTTFLIVLILLEGGWILNKKIAAFILP